IVTMNVLEEYLKGFQGCVIVVSHDRYFMDKLVDHLLVFNGEGDIRDFPGNYTQYREWKELQIEQATARTTQKGSSEDSKSGRVRLNEKPRMSYKERLEYQALDKEIPLLEQQKADLEAVLCAGTADSNTITEIAKQLAVLSDSIDEKSMRWLELSELV
nr:ABC transporter ATP-binding protein [Bacteroidaceae bacterium]